MTLLLALMLAIPPCTSGVAGPAHSVSTAGRRVTVCTIPFIKVEARGNNPQWVKVSGGAWAPTPAQLLTVKTGFEAYIKAEAAKYGTTLAPWQDYTFQYQGQLSGRRQVLAINAFCQVPAGFHRQQLSNAFYRVLEGGPCYFQASWDAKSKSFVSVGFNQ